MTYREMVLKTIEIACNDLKGRAEEIVPDTEGLTSVDLVLHIPTMTDCENSIPTIKVVTDAYPRHVATDEIIQLLDEYKKG